MVIWNGIDPTHMRAYVCNHVHVFTQMHVCTRTCKCAFGLVRMRTLASF